MGSGSEGRRWEVASRDWGHFEWVSRQGNRMVESTVGENHNGSLCGLETIRVNGWELAWVRCLGLRR